jgi:hypothetical protein
MLTAVFATGVALFLVGGVAVGPVGLVLAAIGTAAAAAVGVRTRGRVIPRGVMLGIAEAAVAIGVIYWWTTGHHANWTAIGAISAAVAAALLVYIAVTVRRLARPVVPEAQ